MNVLDPKFMNESISELLKILKNIQTITETECQFFKEWLDFWRQLFERQIQHEIEEYERHLKGAHQKYVKRYHTRFGTIQLSRTSYRKTNGYECLAENIRLIVA